MRIAILGTRGVPARYGGFETFAEELGSRLAARGDDVTVYGRAHVVDRGTRQYRQMRVRVLPTIRHKYLDTVVHTGISATDSLLRGFDVALVCNNANAPFAWIPRLVGTRVVLNIDGLEWERGKWNALGRWYYRVCANLAPRLPGVTLVSDARVVADYYRSRYRARTEFIPYGADARIVPPGPALEAFGLEAGRYLLYVSRLEPENNAHVVIESYRRSGGLGRLGVPLVVVGDAPYATDYRRRLEDAAQRVPGVLLTGYVFGDGYAELQSNCLLYLQATEVGGTHPALLEAMGRGAVVVANDVPEHREVLGDAGAYYERNAVEDLASVITSLVGDPARRAVLGDAARRRAVEQFSWEHVTDEYQSLFLRLVGDESR